MPIPVTTKGIGCSWRLIHDSRFLNGFLNKWKFSLEKPTDFLKILRREGRLWSADISQANQTASINPDYQTPLGFEFEVALYCWATQFFRPRGVRSHLPASSRRSPPG